MLYGPRAGPCPPGLSITVSYEMVQMIVMVIAALVVSAAAVEILTRR